ncbi:MULTISPECIES: DUF1326 domain-containing protein [unclassified Mesorhizobium]|uniref:DUF1326 domain-containing protein n=1 Tax=unclassified Mesorhizobium TaxID=325217 RepID=UPI000F74E000|nr:MULTISPECIES: DUF1326 domain-containing protein [unclassified Mesorhizobium]TGT60380.1 DUF1326 domain-containing protein [Mesorhizobium sp. M00.F.Ca.ET.170.01.1.1]AZO10514.1 DUF1326 domain-containing protein [Mesorhizobium sp. M3A.F.Ca.ET.080.04.2.1]RWB69172.1 MAG: DUF1326 domain-containing protein [Mesorhizobium sp.]RWB84179.1 MAG: DUF1326 domain-containing protein [Mesorhizobium sp.]RWE25740.1 MAG: DUF1326 domain-containing protein [Mesorhizobium sp.]
MAISWQLSGSYFENCNCDVVCPCLLSTNAQLTSKPTQGVCDVALVFHIDQGNYGDVRLDDLNVAMIAHTPGPMAEGNWTAAAYIDERADERQMEALGAIFTGAAGGPMAAFAPMIGNNLGAKKTPIRYQVDGKKRSAEIPGVMHMAVEPLPTMREDGEMWAATGHPVNPDRLTMAMGVQGSTFSDHGMNWDNSGRNGHYAPINWSGQQ